MQGSPAGKKTSGKQCLGYRDDSSQTTHYNFAGNSTIFVDVLWYCGMKETEVVFPFKYWDLSTNASKAIPRRAEPEGLELKNLGGSWFCEEFRL